MEHKGTGLLLSRRALLCRTALAAGLLTISRVRPMPALAAAPDQRSTLTTLSATEAAIMAAIAERMVFSEAADMPRFRDTSGLATIDRALSQLDSDVRQQLRWLLWGFEWGPPVFAFRLTRFTCMSPEAQDEYLRGWATSRSELRLLAFRALKNLSVLGYYAQPPTWPAIHYEGPWIGRVAGQGGTGSR